MTVPGRAALYLMVALSAAAIESQFFRIAYGAIAPDLIRDLALSPAMLAWAGSAFFLALLAGQIPVGIAFDRLGVRVTITALTVLAAAGALWQAGARDAAEMFAARFLIGLGCAGNMMGAVVLCGRWFPPDRFATMLSRVFAAASIGSLFAATPLAALSEWIGWRGAFVLAAAFALAIGALFWLLARDDPPGAASGRTTRTESLGDIISGLIQVWRSPGLGHVMAIHFVAYAAMIAVLGFWATPYLADIHGMTAVERGNVMLAMAVAQIVGTIVFGPLDRIFNTRKWVVVGGALLTMATLLALAAIAAPPAWLAVTLLVGVCLFSTYSVAIVAHGRALFPPHLVGRGATTVNIAQVSGSVALPVLAGNVIGWVSGDGPRTEWAYRLAFAVLAACLALGLMVYLRARDIKPRDV